MMERGGKLIQFPADMFLSGIGSGVQLRLPGRPDREVPIFLKVIQQHIDARLGHRDVVTAPDLQEDVLPGYRLLQQREDNGLQHFLNGLVNNLLGNEGKGFQGERLVCAGDEGPPTGGGYYAGNLLR